MDDWDLDGMDDGKTLEASAIILAGSMVSRYHRGVTPRELLAVLRRRERLSQREISRRTGIRQARLSDIETGRSSACWDEVEKVLRAMRLEPVLLAGPLAGKSRFRYTEPACSPT